MIETQERIKASELELKEKVVAVKRVTKVVKGGQKSKFTAMVVVGSQGIVGYGLGKGKEVGQAVQKGVHNAAKNLFKVPLQRGTLPHEVIGKCKGSRVFLKPAAPGTGVKAGGQIRMVLESIGIENVLSKSKGNSNPQNVVKATFDALYQLRDPRTVARQRGISLDKVFNG